MSDIVEWLKKECPRDSLARDARLQEAADEIEALRQRVAAQDELLREMGEALDWMHGSNRYLTREAVQALTKYRVWAK